MVSSGAQLESGTGSLRPEDASGPLAPLRDGGWRPLETLRGLVLAHRSAIFGEIHPDFQLIELTVSEPLHRTGGRYHHLVEATCRNGGEFWVEKIWVKVRDEDLAPLFHILSDIHETMPEVWEFFPRPYFFHPIGKDGHTLVGMQYFPGVTLRNMLLTRLGRHRQEELHPLFLKLGAKLRAFHDGSPKLGLKRIRHVAANVRNALSHTPHLRQKRKKEFGALIDRAEAAAGPDTALPLTRIHNDFILRNILVGEDGSLHLVDLDSLRAPANSRWYDVAYFLISLESQGKYAPVISEAYLGGVWRKFIEGYVGSGLPDGLDATRIEPILFLIKAEFLLGPSYRVPLFEMFSDLLGRRYLRRVTRAALEGRYSPLPLAFSGWSRPD